MLNSTTEPNPNKVPIQPPIIAPIIPTIIDIIQLAFTGTGCMALANAPTIKPNKIHDNIPIVVKDKNFHIITLWFSEMFSKKLQYDDLFSCFLFNRFLLV